MTEPKIIEQLRELGFNTYEAKVYVALLKQNPSTGYEISKSSGVPQARAYDTLKALLDRNYVVADNTGRPVTYTPIPPEELLDRWERSFTTSLDYLRDALPTVVSHESAEPVSIMRGRESIFRQVLEMIRHAKQAIFMQLWSEDAEILADALKEAQARGVKLYIVGYQDCRLDGVRIYQHAWGEDIQDSMNGRWMSIAVDEREGIVGRICRDGVFPQALMTRNQCIVALLKELVVHDIYLQEVESSLPEEMERLYGKNLFRLRQKILNESALDEMKGIASF